MTTTATKTMDNVLNCLFRPAVEYNWISKDFWKVIFVEGKAYVASGYHVLEISNLPSEVKPQGLYFDFAKNEWGNNLDFPIGIEDINKMFSIKEQGFFDTNFNLLLQYCNSFDDEIKRDSRIVIASHQTKNDELTLSFDIDEHGKRICDQGTVQIYVGLDSQIKNEDIIPKMPYVCKISEVMGNQIRVNVLAPAGVIKMGMYHSTGCFVMENAEQADYIHSMRELPQEFMYTAFKPVNGYTPNPIHLDAGMFIDIIKAFSVSNDLFVRIGTSEDPNIPITIESLGSPDSVKVRAVMATLNPFMGPQRR